MKFEQNLKSRKIMLKAITLYARTIGSCRLKRQSLFDNFFKNTTPVDLFRFGSTFHVFSPIIIYQTVKESARAAAELARDFAPNIDCKWGEGGLDDIAQDSSIHGVAVVLAGQIQVSHTY